MPTSKQSHPPVTKSAICPNCGIAQVMYDARLVDIVKEEDRKFDVNLIPTTMIIKISSTSSPPRWANYLGRHCSRLWLRTSWPPEPMLHKLKYGPYSATEVTKFQKKIWSGDTCGPEPLDPRRFAIVQIFLLLNICTWGSDLKRLPGLIFW